MILNLKDYYAILKIDPRAHQRQIREAYYELARQYNPALNPDDERFVKLHEDVTEAYEILSHEGSRREYDEQYNQYPWEQARIDRIVNNEFRNLIIMFIGSVFLLIIFGVSIVVSNKYYPPLLPEAAQQNNTMIDSSVMKTTEPQADSIAADIRQRK